MIRKKKVWWCQLTIPKSKESTALAMTSRVPPPQQLPHIPLPQLGVQPQFWNSAGCPDPTISPVCLWHWNKKKNSDMTKNSRAQSGRNAKISKTCQNISQSSCSNIEFCKPNRNKSTAMLQKDIYQVTEADQANIWNCIKKWVSSTKPTKYYFFHLKKKKGKRNLF